MASRMEGILLDYSTPGESQDMSSINKMYRLQHTSHSWLVGTLHYFIWQVYSRFVLNCDCAISSLTFDFKTNYNMSMTMTKYLSVVLAPYHVSGRRSITSPRSVKASSSRLRTFDLHYSVWGPSHMCACVFRCCLTL